MSKQDPIADGITMIRNAQAVSKKTVTVPASTLFLEILRVMHAEGYIESYALEDEAAVKRRVVITLKYFEGKPVIDVIKRMSSPGRRAYCGANDWPKERDGLGTIIVTTSQGVMTAHNAQKLRLGGELLVSVY